MALKVIGAGVGRTGTSSLRRAFEYLFGADCYHMRELLDNPDHVSFWHDAAFGKEVDWRGFFENYAAAVDWPATAFWPELMEVYPDALVLLSLRDGEAWWESARKTIYAPRDRGPDFREEMTQRLSVTRFPIHPLIHTDKKGSIDLFNKWNQNVIDTVPPERLLVWNAAEGWEPICAALGVPIPDMPFPHANSLEEWMARIEQIKRDQEGSN